MIGVLVASRALNLIKKKLQVYIRAHEGIIQMVLGGPVSTVIEGGLELLRGPLH